MNTYGLAIIYNECKQGNYSSIRMFAAWIMVFFFAITIYQLDAANEFKNYDTAEAYITDVATGTELTSKGSRTVYSYNVHWYYDGENHITKINSQIDPPDYNLTEVRVNPVTEEMTLGSTEGSYKGALLTIGISFAAFLIWGFLLLISKNRKKEMHHTSVLSMSVGILGLVITLLCRFVVYSDVKYGSSVEAVDFMIYLSLFATIAGLVLMILTREKQKSPLS